MEQAQEAPRSGEEGFGKEVGPAQSAVKQRLGHLMSDHETSETSRKKKRQSGIPTGNAGEYFVMGELLRRGYDAQLADRNTKRYDVLVGRPEDRALRKVQIKAVRAAPWYVNRWQFRDDFLSEVTIYVLIGHKDAEKAVRFFIARNCDVADLVHWPPKWEQDGKETGFMSLKALEPYEGNWKAL